MSPFKKSAGAVARETESETPVFPDGRYLVLSDLHLGSRFCRHEALAACLDGLPAETALVLNGDVVDRIHARLPPPHTAILDRLRDASWRRPVIWIYGNHDAGYRIDPPGRIHFANDAIIANRLYLAHGHGFDAIMPAYPWFLQAFRRLHHLRVALGAEAVHVAVYAKRWDRLYRILRRHVQRHAVRHAHRHGCASVACGHTHFAEEQVADGVRYINTGAWTERPAYGLWITPSELELRCLAE